MEKFDGRINFGLWHIHVNNELKRSRLHKDLNGARSSKGSDSDVSSFSFFIGDVDHDAQRVRGVILMVCLFTMEEDVLLLSDPQVYTWAWFVMMQGV